MKHPLVAEIQHLCMDSENDRKRLAFIMGEELKRVAEAIAIGWNENGEEMEADGLRLADHIEANIATMIAHLLDLDQFVIIVSPPGLGPKMKRRNQ